ncbi:hypothetical protein TthSNM66_18460 [Thermus thermophilus]|nr:hypothetical protein TthSNM66_18460 [Thermus thermophilus]
MYRYNHYVWGSPLSPSEKLLLLYVLDRCDENGTCWPSLNTISRDTGFSRRGVIQILERLRALGVLSWHVAEEGGERGPRIYRVHIERIRALGGERSAPGGEHSAPPGETTAPGVVNGVHHLGNLVHQGGAPDARGVVHAVHSNHPIEPNKEPPTTTPPFIPPQSHPDAEPQGGGGGGEKATNASRSGEPNQASLEGFRAAGETLHKDPAVLAAWEARRVDRMPSPPFSEAGASAVRALREAGLWERFAALRRHATDRRAWDEWLHGPVARHYQRLGPEGFVRAVREALDGLAARPDLARPLIWLERQLGRATPPPAPAEEAKDPLEELIEAIVAEDEEAIKAIWVGR